MYCSCMQCKSTVHFVGCIIYQIPNSPNFLEHCNCLKLIINHIDNFQGEIFINENDNALFHLLKLQWCLMGLTFPKLKSNIKINGELRKLSMRRTYLIPDYSLNQYIIIMNISSTEAKKCCLLPNETIIKSLVRIDNDIQMPVCQTTDL